MKYHINKNNKNEMNKKRVRMMWKGKAENERKIGRIG